MINDSGENIALIGSKSGEYFGEIRPGEKINIRSVVQQRRDKWFGGHKVVSIRGTFKKMISENLDDVLNRLKDSHTAFYALIILCKYLLTDYNLLVKDGRKFKIMDLADEMGIVRQRASDYMKRLKNENLVCEIETSMGKYWAVNPYYFCNGSGCDERVVKAFEKQAQELAEKKKKQNS